MSHRHIDAIGMAWAAECASQSNDPSTQNGAVIIASDGGFSTGWNHHIDLSQDDPDVIAALSRDDKMAAMEHAERDAIYLAAKIGFPLEGTTMYALWASCPACARAIVLSGISRVVTWQKLHDLTPDRWRKQVDFGLSILQGAGVLVDFWPGEIESSVPFVRFDGREIEIVPLSDEVPAVCESLN